MKKKNLLLLSAILIGVVLIMLTNSSYATSTRNNNANTLTEEQVQNIVDEKVQTAVEGVLAQIQSNEEENKDEESSSGVGMIAAAIATGLACIGAGIAVAVVASSAIGAISENPALLGKTIILAGLAEGIAIYGLIISIMILNKI